MRGRPERPFAPGKVQQPAVAAAAECALQGNGSFRLVGGEGIHFRSGKTFTDVVFDVTVAGGLVFVVVMPGSGDPRFASEHESFHVGSRCLHEFNVDETTMHCSVCTAPRCPECGACDCETTSAVCTSCNMSLPSARLRAGKTLCEECE